MPDTLPSWRDLRWERIISQKVLSLNIDQEKLLLLRLKQSETFEVKCGLLTLLWWHIQAFHHPEPPGHNSDTLGQLMPLRDRRHRSCTLVCAAWPFYVWHVNLKWSPDHTEKWMLRLNEKRTFPLKQCTSLLVFLWILMLLLILSKCSYFSRIDGSFCPKDALGFLILHKMFSFCCCSD